MAGSDDLLDSTGTDRWGLVDFRGDYISLPDLKARAGALQREAMRSKLAGDHKRAVAIYRELLPHVRLLDELEVFAQPPGMPEQLILRAIELEEAGDVPPVYVDEACADR